MSVYQNAGCKSNYQTLPKVELHRHLEGSLRMETLLDVARVHGITLPLRPDLRSLVQMQTSDALTFSNFLSKFQTLRLFYRSPEVITRITREAVEDAAADNIQYLELRFSPVALSRLEGFPLAEVMNWVSTAALQAGKDFGILVRLLVSVNRHEDIHQAEQALHLAADYHTQGIIGVDLAGNEADFSAAPFAALFREAKQAGLGITVHAGEWGGPENVRQAILEMGADRIGHGVRIMEDANVVALALEHNTTFEVCITSNYQTGVAPALSAHPLMRMLMAGLNVTLNTDDPSISQISLSNEYRVACQDLGLPANMLRTCILTAIQASFLSADERTLLQQQLMPKLDQALFTPEL
ncbi:MAG: adenosine deaminase [Anaerolinea sp.]|nr:adenosine deaminase [Anaerolinea sp.]